MEPAVAAPSVERFPPSASFRELADRFAHLETNGYDKSFRFRVEGRVITKRKLSKTLAFMEISRLADDGADTDPFLCQLILEAAPEDRINGISESFKARLDYFDREVHVGDVIEAFGYPKKSIKGRVSIHLETLNIITRFRDAFPGLHFDAGRFRTQYRDKIRELAQANPGMVVVTSANGYVTDISLCKWVIRGVSCKDKNCKMRHEPTAKDTARIQRERARRDAMLEAQHDPNDPFDDKQKKKMRAAIFAKWLVDKFGAERLNIGEGVLDVAGGTGRLSFELFAKHDVKTTLVDPRALKVTKKQAIVIKERNLTLFKQIQDYFDEDMWTDPNCPPAVKDCSVVIGLHPDQATEPIVDFALSHNKPFAVVPCCVFPHLWPDRKVKGKPVVVYSDLIEYLCQKDPRIQADFLDMNGRNKVLWMDPTANPATEESASKRRKIEETAGN